MLILLIIFIIYRNIGSKAITLSLSLTVRCYHCHLSTLRKFRNGRSCWNFTTIWIIRKMWRILSILKAVQATGAIRTLVRMSMIVIRRWHSWRWRTRSVGIPSRWPMIRPFWRLSWTSVWWPFWTILGFFFCLIPTTWFLMIIWWFFWFIGRRRFGWMFGS